METKQQTMKKNNKTKDKTELIAHSNNELPMLHYEMTEYADHTIIRNIQFVSKATNIKDCKKGMNYLFDKHKQHKTSNNAKDSKVMNYVN